MALPPPAPQGVNAVDIVEHYAFPADLDGAGARIALVEFGGTFTPSELDIASTLAGLRVPTVIDVPVGSLEADPDFTPTVARDVQLLAAAAPGAEIVVYRIPNTELGVSDGVAEAVYSEEHPPTVVCLPWSFAASSNPMLAGAVEQALEAAVLMGVTVCAAADPTPGDAPYPALSAHALACGATGAVSADDDTWSEAPGPDPGTAGDRRLPDVSCLGEAPYAFRVFSRGQWLTAAGAGCSTCLWSGLVARLVQGLGRPLGWMNGLLEDLGPAGVLRGAVGAPPGRWAAGVGWGSPDGERMLAALKTSAGP